MYEPLVCNRRGLISLCRLSSADSKHQKPSVWIDAAVFSAESRSIELGLGASYGKEGGGRYLLGGVQRMHGPHVRKIT